MNNDGSPIKKRWFSDPNNRAGWDHELLEASFGESTVQFGSLVHGWWGRVCIELVQEMGMLNSQRNR